MTRQAAQTGRSTNARTPRTLHPVGLGPGLRRAWIGYQRLVDDAMAAAGFDDRGFPDGRVLRMCTRSDQITISQIGRDLGITRQRASKIVAGLRDRGYLTVTPSPTSGREKVLTTTPRAHEYLAAQRKAVRNIERQVRDELGPDAFTALRQLVELLTGNENPRLRDYLRTMGIHER